MSVSCVRGLPYNWVLRDSGRLSHHWNLTCYSKLETKKSLIGFGTEGVIESNWEIHIPLRYACLTMLTPKKHWPSTHSTTWLHNWIIIYSVFFLNRKCLYTFFFWRQFDFSKPQLQSTHSVELLVDSIETLHHCCCELKKNSSQFFQESFDMTWSQMMMCASAWVACFVNRVSSSSEEAQVWNDEKIKMEEFSANLFLYEFSSA